MTAYPQPTPRAMSRDLSPLIGVIPVAGPPAVLFAGPWILLALLLAGPVVLIVTVVVVLLVAALLIAAIAAAPYLLVRHLRSHHAASAELAEPLPVPAMAGRGASPVPGF